MSWGRPEETGSNELTVPQIVPANRPGDNLFCPWPPSLHAIGFCTASHLRNGGVLMVIFGPARLTHSRSLFHACLNAPMVNPALGMIRTGLSASRRNLDPLFAGELGGQFRVRAHHTQDRVARDHSHDLRRLVPRAAHHRHLVDVCRQQPLEQLQQRLIG